jgi:hypothetical protein
MALGQFHEREFLRGREPIGGALRPRAPIREGTLEGCERAVAPLIKDAAAHPEAGRHVGNWFAIEQGEDGVQTMFPSRACRL